MDSNKNSIISIMDILNLDESLIDSRLESIINRKSFEITHLQNALHLIDYKYLLNTSEGTNCDNEREIEFSIKLISCINEHNIDYICSLFKKTLLLNKESIESHVEHLLQQLIHMIVEEISEASKLLLLYLKIIDAVLDALLVSGLMIQTLFLDEEILEKIVNYNDDNLRKYFLTNITPKIINCVYNNKILDVMWTWISNHNTNLTLALRALSSLSIYYLPLPDMNGKVLYNSDIVTRIEFWKLLLRGFYSDNLVDRKFSLFLAKRSLDLALHENIPRNIVLPGTDEPIFFWDPANNANIIECWTFFFIVYETLEEKQSNIVLPALNLFSKIESINVALIKSALKMGLQHECTSVVMRSLEIYCEQYIENNHEAEYFLDGFNKVSTTTYILNNQCFIDKFQKLLEKNMSLLYILNSIYKINWSTVALYTLTVVLRDISLDDAINSGEKEKILAGTKDILKYNFNHYKIKEGAKTNILKALINSSKFDVDDFLYIYDCFESKDHVFLKSLDFFNKWICEQTNLTNLGWQNIVNSHQYITLIFLISVDQFKLNIIHRTVSAKLDNIENNKLTPHEARNDYLYVVRVMGGFYANKDLNRLPCDYIKLLEYIISYLKNSIVNSNEIDIDICEAMFPLRLAIDQQKHPDKLKELKQLAFEIFQTSDNIPLIYFSIKILMCFYEKTNELCLQNPCKDARNKFCSWKKIAYTNVATFGKNKSMLYAELFKFIHIDLKKDNFKMVDVEFYSFLVEALTTAGYNSLVFILDIFLNILNIQCLKKVNYTRFLTNAWKEIGELKLKQDFEICVKKFIHIILHKSLLREVIYNNLIISYCQKYIEYENVSPRTLSVLIEKIESDIHFYLEYLPPLVFVQLIVFLPDLRKEQRFVYGAVISMRAIRLMNVVLKNCFNDTTYSRLLLCKFYSPVIPASFGKIVEQLMLHVDELFKNKHRYYADSFHHRILLRSLQYILWSILTDSKYLDMERIKYWCMNYLMKLPHQPNIKFMFEWIIALYFVYKRSYICRDLVIDHGLQLIPLTSHFTILYYVVKHRLLVNTLSYIEYEHVMDFLLTHIMGQQFNIRLHAQYLALSLHKANNFNEQKYTHICSIIQHTFKACSNEKCLIRIENDYLVNKFDVIKNLSLSFIYYHLPKYTNMIEDEIINSIISVKDFKYLFDIPSQRTNYINKCLNEDLMVDLDDSEIFVVKQDSLEHDENEYDKLSNTIQKKFIPWKDMMQGLEIQGVEKKCKKSELIVVASLIDKLPNLGGLVRTSEVFGVKKYIIDSLKHLQHKEFKGLSVSAENWVDVEEIRPGVQLKEYIHRMKLEGYTVVAAEQTSDSQSLESYKFPVKTLLLLGHEKNGIPCDLLSYMDMSVEIPQQGVIRSLNVHVTASIFIWEYVKQNVLK